MGNPRTFAIALGLIAVWGMSGFFVGFGDSWQLVANTTTTILTTLMVLLVQHTQNRDAQAMQIKLNEIIRGLSSTRNKVIALEDREPDEAEVFRQEFNRIRDEEN
jgi:low affinity Fe/Cu permease